MALRLQIGRRYKMAGGVGFGVVREPDKHSSKHVFVQIELKTHWLNGKYFRYHNDGRYAGNYIDPRNDGDRCPDLVELVGDEDPELLREWGIGSVMAVSSDYYPERDDPGPVSLRPGGSYAFADKYGSVVAQGRVFEGSKGFWCLVDRPGHQMHGQRAPYFWNGRYAGSSAWLLPNLGSEIGADSDCVDVPFDVSELADCSFDVD